MAVGLGSHFGVPDGVWEVETWVEAGLFQGLLQLFRAVSVDEVFDQEGTVDVGCLPSGVEERSGEEAVEGGEVVEEEVVSGETAVE